MCDHTCAGQAGIFKYRVPTLCMKHIALSCRTCRELSCLPLESTKSTSGPHMMLESKAALSMRPARQGTIAGISYHPFSTVVRSLLFCEILGLCRLPEACLHNSAGHRTLLLSRVATLDPPAQLLKPSVFWRIFPKLCIITPFLAFTGFRAPTWSGRNQNIGDSFSDIRRSLKHLQPHDFCVAVLLLFSARSRLSPAETKTGGCHNPSPNLNLQEVTLLDGFALRGAMGR